MTETLVLPIIELYSQLYLWLTNLAGSYGLAAIYLSFLNALFLQPLSDWSRSIANKEAEIQEVITPQIRHIRQNYKGGEQHLATARLYSRYAYHPIFAVRSVVPLLVQLPFLGISYLMFAGLKEIHGVSFLLIDDLSQPDQLFPFIVGDGNTLPFLMLALGILGTIFTKGSNEKNWGLDLVLTFAIFLLLYNQPSILLIFWISNLASSLFWQMNWRDKKRASKGVIHLISLLDSARNVFLSKEFLSFGVFVCFCSTIFWSFLNLGMIRLFSGAFFYAAWTSLIFLTLLHASLFIRRGTVGFSELTVPISSNSKVYWADLLATDTTLLHYSIRVVKRRFAYRRRAT